jgi:hypothetical protein
VCPCIHQANCEWADYRCAGKDTGEECNTYTMSTCPARCSIDWQEEVCVGTPCSSYYDVGTCNAHKKDGCQFDQDTYSCYSDPDPTKPCQKFSSYYECPSNRCFFTYDVSRLLFRGSLRQLSIKRLHVSRPHLCRVCPCRLRRSARRQRAQTPAAARTSLVPTTTPKRLASLPSVNTRMDCATMTPTPPR